MRFEAPRKLEERDVLDHFGCGAEVVDAWVRGRAASAERRGTAVVYVSCCEGEVAGIYSLCSHSIIRDNVQGDWLRRNAPKNIPAILLGMLGVDERFKGYGLGASLLGDAIRRSRNIADQIGAKALLVDPVDEQSEAFYAKYGFRAISGMNRMYLPLK
ncbi:MAG: GNAT family N-acetyltransferase [Eggerthellaceae bacterium]|nr:GNAT family N-acetyltransferase [Eggerthellaceae bacterium]